ncbi:MAG: hypothetical protein AB7S49_01395 [Arcobacter sp.]|uniref:hypothetical protein n=1 Tax=Arcobacter sp. TaxID=1872629 RepID=UPI003D084431
MKKGLILIVLMSYNLVAHPVNYTIELEVSYNENTKEAKVICQSNSKNKCGLYNANLLNEKDETLVDVKFPFLKDFILIKTDIKPIKLDFYLRQTPEHKYSKVF